MNNNDGKLNRVPEGRNACNRVALAPGMMHNKTIDKSLFLLPQGLKALGEKKNA